MNKQNHYPLMYLSPHFHCPHCGVYAEQKWSFLRATGHLPQQRTNGITTFLRDLPKDWIISACEHCKKIAIWYEQNMIYPKKIVVTPPNSDLEEEIQQDYLEAANIFNYSPRASAALLRLALQKLCKQLGEKGKNINEDIGKLVEKGLNSQVQKALDSLRIIGNNGVHPGKINVGEDSDKVLKLFEIVNFIAEKMITDQKEIDDFYANLPESSKEQIIKRDKKRGEE